MKLAVKTAWTLLSFCSIVSVSVAQHNKDDVLLTAMKDELERSLKELKHPEFEKPFFIMYGIQDQKSYSVAGSLGSLIQSKENKNRFKSTTRVLVGDYSFNDESLEDNMNSSPTALEIYLPEEDDYMGIRRAFWSSTDKVYRDAARHFQRHQQTVKESGKSLDEIPHRSFAKGKALTLIQTLPEYRFDKVAWEKKIRDLSAAFLGHPEILYSSVAISFTDGNHYLANSEGVLARLPFRNASFTCIAQLKGKNGEIVVDQIIHRASNPDQLPSFEQLDGEIRNLITRIEKQTDVPVFPDEYTGPVILSGAPVADLFASGLFSGNESIIASNYITALTGYQYNRSNSMDMKIGKLLLSPQLTIKAKPTLKNFQGVDLLGSFDLDDEGITPPDELVIFENGVLKSLLNDRTITHTSQTANGFSSGPGVLEVSIKESHPDEILKKKLIEEAKEQGLEYALIIRQSSFLTGLVNVYKVFVADGKEELVRNALLGDLNSKILRRIIAASEQQSAHNIGGSNFMGQNQGPFVSYIVPASVLVKEMEVKPFDMPTLHEEEFVSNPLKGNK